MTLRFHNSTGRTYRVTLAAAGACVFLAQLAYLAPGNRFATNAATGIQSVYFLVFILSACGAVTLLIAALLTGLAAQKADRAFAAFCQGELLADWPIDPLDWRRYLILQEANSNWIILGGFLLSGGAAAMLVAFFIWSGASTLTGKVVGLTMNFLCAAVLGWLMIWLSHSMANKRFERMRNRPRVLIGRDGVCCGTTFHRWNTAMISLHAVNIVPGDPTLMEFTIGPSEVLRAINTAVDTVNVILTVAGGQGGASGTGTGQYKIQVPIPCEHVNDAMLFAKMLRKPSC